MPGIAFLRYRFRQKRAEYDVVEAQLESALQMVGELEQEIQWWNDRPNSQDDNQDGSQADISEINVTQDYENCEDNTSRRSTLRD